MISNTPETRTVYYVSQIYNKKIYVSIWPQRFESDGFSITVQDDKGTWSVRAHLCVRKTSA